MKNQNVKFDFENQLETPPENQDTYENYTCPICGLTIRRDTYVFLLHAKRHLFDALLKMHPEWGGTEEGYKMCQRYLDRQIKH